MLRLFFEGHFKKMNSVRYKDYLLSSHFSLTIIRMIMSKFL